MNTTIEQEIEVIKTCIARYEDTMHHCENGDMLRWPILDIKKLLSIVDDLKCENDRVQKRLERADALLTLLVNRIADYPTTRRTNKDEWALDAYEDYKSNQ